MYYTYRLLAIGSKRLLVAAMEDDTASITELVNDKDISVDTEFYHNGYTALHQSSDNGNSETVKLLINLGADVNKKVLYSGKFWRELNLANLEF